MVTAGLPFTDLLHSYIARTGLVVSALMLVLMFIPLLSIPGDEFEARKYFKRINYFVLAVVLFMALDKIAFKGLF